MLIVSSSRLGTFGKVKVVLSVFLCFSNFHKITGHTMNRLSGHEDAKRVAAYQAVDDHIKNNTAVGIGSGSTVIYAVDRLAEKINKEHLKIVCVATSFQSRQLILNHKLTLGDLETHPDLSCVIDGADEVDDKLLLIKGGGGCLTQEKIVASCTSNVIIIADHTKLSKHLGDNYKRGIPIEVIPLSYVPVIHKIETMLGGKAPVRMAKSKAGPVVTDNGNFILDWQFPPDIQSQQSWEAINSKLIHIPGVVETGLFINMVSHVYFGMPDGTFLHKDVRNLNPHLQGSKTA
ncbi:hypothetical protein WDU94_013635 [Cyamophila willieti]